VGITTFVIPDWFRGSIFGHRITGVRKKSNPARLERRHLKSACLTVDEEYRFFGTHGSEMLSNSIRSVLQPI
jgi:hypothetical protein